MKYPPVEYSQYLGLKEILNAQNLRSSLFQKTSHEEMLFIITHQTYELWFKQMLFELDSVMKLFAAPKIQEKDMGVIVARLERIVHIQKFINGQIDILETMTPLDFLDFREFLYPASGFQSFQWRAFESKLGLRNTDRLAFNESPFYKALRPEDQTLMLAILESDSLLDLVEKWLERTPFLQFKDFSFWDRYQKVVKEFFEEERSVINSLSHLSPADRQRALDQTNGSFSQFEALFDGHRFKNLVNEGYFRMNAKAIQAALFIQLYREQPILQMPFRLLQALMDLDEHMTQWRDRHALMAHRMLGKKIGTSGSSGHDYLKATSQRHKVFQDFFNLTTFLIPKSRLPEVPTELLQKMSFFD
jgi:tryptophan 2,3-dioxygenase